MEEKTYSDQLLSPKWQKKRLEIMQRDGFCCSKCLDETTTLNVHHKRYIKGKKPWEYPNHYLTTLCATCHKIEHSEEISKAISSLLKGGISEQTILKCLDKRHVEFAKDFHPELFKHINLDEILKRYQLTLGEKTSV